MSFLVLHADRLATVVSDDPIVPAADIPGVRDAIALLAEAGRLRDAARDEVAAATARGHAEGLEAGRTEGREAAEAEGRAELFRLAVRDGELRRSRQAEVAALALEVVRRIAGEVGPEALVAGIAERAARDLAPDTAAVVRVAPAHAEAVRARLTGRAGLAVEADDGVAATDCVIETALGHTHAGLETQLTQIERAWAGGHG